MPARGARSNLGLLPLLPSHLLPTALGATLLLAAVSSAADSGRELFAKNCGACHQLEAVSFGPPLGGITRLLDESTLTQWIADPAAVLASGDTRAKALLARYQVPMPAFAHLGEDRIRAIIAYLHEETESRDLAPRPVAPVSADADVRFVPPIVDSGIVLTVEPVAEVPRLPDRPAYAGIALLRPDPRDADALLVNDLMGPLYQIKDGAAHLVFHLREHFPRFTDSPGVASGFGAFAFHPDFLRNGLLYTTHSELWAGEDVINPGDLPEVIPADASPRLAWVLDEWRIDLSTTGGRLIPVGPPREVMRWLTPTTAHGSQEIAFAPIDDPSDPDYGLLYIGHGDGGSINLKVPDRAGHPRTLLGSMMRIDPRGSDGRTPSYGIPPTNPFADTADPTIHREIYAYGFRNVHRFSWDFAHGRRLLIGVDIGETNIEEVNLIEPGGSYGWGRARLEGPARIDVLDDPTVIHPATAEQLAGTILPHGAYDHREGQAITGGYVYHGPITLLRDRYIFGDIVNGRLFSMNFGPELDDHTISELNFETAAGEPTTLKEIGDLKRAHLRVSYDPRDGTLYLMTKDDGMIRRVTGARRR